LKPRLLLAESKDFSPEAKAILSNSFQIECGDFNLPELIEHVKNVEYLWVRLRNFIGRPVLDAAPNLKVIATNTTGLNHIDLATAEQRGIKIVSLRGEVEFLKTIRATAELTIGLALSLLRRIPLAHASVLDGSWNRESFQGRELFEKTVGIVGFGRLGSIVANYFRALGSQVLVCDPKFRVGENVDGFQVVSLDDLVKKVDLVSLHANFTFDNRGFIGRGVFRQMRRGAWLINTARGELVDEAAMLDAIRNQILGGVALDVIDSEHKTSETLADLRRLISEGFNIVLTPHIGGHTLESTSRTELFLANKLVATVSTELLK
jgi:D-3-phosphoglycerate dehydrogenase / 2-oxoglutarate reductase